MKKIAAVGVGVLFLTACQTVPYQGTARNVQLKPKKQGVISIPLNFRDEDRTKAEGMIARNCKPYLGEILQEGEVAVGKTTSSSGKETNRDDTRGTVGSLFGIPITTGEAGGKNTNSTSTTTDVKEWHISYKCNPSKKG
ncbi:MAG: hypothetical protein CL676_13735 [Bdellovibrionaceae bacterium]|nr:hypothetical protein [Pseudobdellovibrionaceae bacterium]|tara:strand:- start:539 stop:955 length:417 start_codon:yes stop_codon:yes gene_type:complete